MSEHETEIRDCLERGLHIDPYNVRGILRELDELRKDKAHSMNWTTEKPTAPGWYWYRDEDGRNAEFIKVFVGSENVNAYFPSEDTYFGADMLTGQFSGPILPPTE